jgi:hypothetical protein
MTNEEKIKEIPKIENKGELITISISLTDLIAIVEKRLDENYKVINDTKLLSAFKFHLENYQDSNAVELGISALQNLFDTIVDEIYVNEDDVIEKPDEY